MIRTTCLGCGHGVDDCVCNITLDHWESITGDTEFENAYDDELAEVIKQIKNRCDAVLWLLENPNAFYVLPTILEDLYQDSQFLIDEYCVDD